MLPSVKILFGNGLIGASSPSDDGVVGLIITGVAVPSKFVLGTNYMITKLDNLAALGITSAGNDVNANIYKVVKEFYLEAPMGTKLWIQGVLNTVTMTEMVDSTRTYAKTMLVAAGGSINLLMVSRSPVAGYTPTVTAGLDSDVFTAVDKAQLLGTWVTDTLYAPILTIIEGRSYTGTPSSLTDLATKTANRVAVMIGDSVQSSAGAAIGILGGRIASIPVQRSTARVRSGALPVSQMYIGANVPEVADPDVISDKGYITLRTFVGKSGYFFTDDKIATATTDDYALIPRRRVIDKAYRIAYQTLIELLNDEIPLCDDGTIPSPIVKSIENMVEVAIQNRMTTYGNLGVDVTNPNDTGVQCSIDSKQNIAATSKLVINLRVKPYGYAKYIEVNLGFKTA